MNSHTLDVDSHEIQKKEEEFLKSYVFYERTPIRKIKEEREEEDEESDSSSDEDDGTIRVAKNREDLKFKGTQKETPEQIAKRIRQEDIRLTNAIKTVSLETNLNKKYERLTSMYRMLLSRYKMKKQEIEIIEMTMEKTIKRHEEKKIKLEGLKRVIHDEQVSIRKSKKAFLTKIRNVATVEELKNRLIIIQKRVDKHNGLKEEHNIKERDLENEFKNQNSKIISKITTFKTKANNIIENSKDELNGLKEKLDKSVKKKINEIKIITDKEKQLQKQFKQISRMIKRSSRNEKKLDKNYCLELLKYETLKGYNHKFENQFKKTNDTFEENKKIIESKIKILGIVLPK